jgi:hypothetical protein
VGREFLRLTNIPLPLAPLPLPPRAGAKIRTSEAEVLPFVWLQGPDASDQRELVWLKLGPKIKDNTRSLVAVLEDERVLAGGSAFITDLGMTGPHDSVIGVKTATIINRFRSSRRCSIHGMTPLVSVDVLVVIS